MNYRIGASGLSLIAGLLAAQPVAAQTTHSGSSEQKEASKADADPQGDDASNADALDLQSVRSSAQQQRNAIAGRPIDSGDGSDIMVTGTRINRPNLTSASPISTITSTEIAQSGAINVEDVLNRSPQVFPSAEQFNEESGTGRQRINLRRLGFNRTLVLLDGLRLNQSEGVDVNSIPVGLLERVDLLTGGASSVYGSDAIGGVVNFILRKDLDGIQLTADYGFYNHRNRDTIVTAPAAAVGIRTPKGLTTDGQRSSISAAAGKNFLDGRLNVSAYVNYREAQALQFKDRDYSACQLARGIQDERELNCTRYFSAYGPNGIIIPNEGPNAGELLANAPDGSRQFESYIPSVHGYNSTGDRYFQRPYERVNAGGFLNFDMSNAAKLALTYMFSSDSSESTNGGSVIPTSGNYGQQGAFRVNCNNPFLSASQATDICGDLAGTSQSVSIDPIYRYPQFTQFGDRIETKSHRASAALRGEIAQGWNYDVGGVYSVLTTTRLPSGLPKPEKIARALQVVDVNGIPTCISKVDGTDPDCVPLDVFRANTVSPGIEQYLFSEPRIGTNARSELIQILGNVTADLTRYGITSPWAKEGLAVAAGVEYRKGSQKNSASQAFYDQFGGNNYNFSQEVYEGNVEAQLPIVQQSFIDLLQVNAGYRYSKYSTNDNWFSTWKLEGVFAPIKDIMFRVAYNKASRAPSVYEANPDVRFDPTGAGKQDFCAPQVDPDTGEYLPPAGSKEACAASGLDPALYGSPTLICPQNACVARIGGFDLRPEDARTLTAGVVLQPRFLPGLTASVDYYQIKINDKISFNYGDFALDSCQRQLLFCDRIVRNPNGTLYGSVANPATGFVIAGTTNEYREENHGWDVQVAYFTDIGENGGALNFSFNGSLTTFSGGQDAPFTLNKNCAGYFGPACAAPIPDWTHNARLGYTTENGFLNTTIAWRHIGPVDSTRNSDNEAIGFGPDDHTIYGKIPGYDFFDLTMSFNVAKQFSLRFVVNNIFDRMPPIVPDSRNEFSRLSRSNTTPERYDPLGRYVNIGVNVNF